MADLHGIIGEFLEGNIKTLGGDANIEPKNITENGTYTAPEGVDGYNPITVNVPSTPPVVEELTATENGTYTVPEGVDGYNPITVNVPSTPPVVEELTATENGTYTVPEGVDGYNPITVNVPSTPPVVEELTATENGTYTPDEGVDGFSPVVVNVPLPPNAYLLKSVANLPQPIASFNDGADVPMKSLKVAIEPQQDLHGYDSPWVGGAGKNKLEVTATSQTINGVTFTVNDDGTIKVNGTATADAKFIIGEYILKAGSSVRLNGSPVDGNTSTIALGYQGYGIVSTANSDRVCDRTSASTDWDNDVYIGVTSGYKANNLTFKPMIRLESVTDATFAPYSNICPISGWDEANITVADDDTDPTISNVYTIDLDGTRYGGTLDVVNGVLTLTHGYIASYNGETLPSTWISDRDVYEEGTTPTIGAEVCYELATPLTIQLTHTAVKSLLGSNNVWADTGDITDVEYFSKETE